MSEESANSVWKSKNLQDVASNKKVLYLGITLLVFGLLTVIAFAYSSIKDGHEKLYIGIAAEQQVLSQRIAKHALEAARGKQESFDTLNSLRNRFAETVDIMRNGDSDSGLPAAPEQMDDYVKSVESFWRGIDGGAERILAGQDMITTISEYVGTINDLVPPLLTYSDEVVEIMVNKKADRDQVYIASRQLMIAQRIENNLNRILVGGSDVSVAADRFGRDAAFFGRVLEGMLQGDAALNVRSLKDEDARLKLGEVSMLFKTVSDHVGGILDLSPDLFLIQESASNMVNDSDLLLDASRDLEEAFAGGVSYRVIPNWIGYTFSAIAFVVMFWLGIQLLVDARHRTDAANRQKEEADEQNRRNQDAIMQLLDEMGDLADGDLTVTATVTEDITGAIADSVNYAIEALRSLVTTINETSVQVSSAAQESQATAMHLAEASDHQAQQITAASAAVNEMAVTIGEVSENARESTEVAERSVSIAHTGAETVRSTITGMNTIREQIQETSKRIKRLGESSQEIGDIVELINDIADQTNILSLNAAIQAAMAGEAGRGFAVVADEVQRLAERSSNATKQIEALVKTIQTDTNEAVISMEQSTSNVVEGAKLAENAGEALDEIEKVSKYLADLIEDISSSSTQQSSAAGNISDTMNVIQEITTQTSAGTNETAASIGNLAELANDLRKSVSDFKLPE